MTSKTLTLLVTACIIGASSPAWSQGAGGGGSGGGAGSSASGASAGTTTGTSATSGTGGTKGNVGTAPSGGTEDATRMTVGPTNTTETDPSSQQTRSRAPPRSPAAIQAQRNAGAGTAPNGLPIGSPGSGLGSPEQPINSGLRATQSGAIGDTEVARTGRRAKGTTPSSDLKRLQAIRERPRSDSQR